MCYPAVSIRQARKNQNLIVCIKADLDRLGFPFQRQSIEFNESYPTDVTKQPTLFRKEPTQNREARNGRR